MSNMRSHHPSLDLSFSVLGVKINMKIDWSKLTLKQAAMVLDVEESKVLTDLLEASDDELYNEIEKEGKDLDTNSLIGLYANTIEIIIDELKQINLVESFAPYFRKLKKAYDRYAKEHDVKNWPEGSEGDKWSEIVYLNQ